MIISISSIINMQEKYEKAMASVAEMQKRVVMAESMLEATLQYESGQTKALSSPRYKYFRYHILIDSAQLCPLLVQIVSYYLLHVSFASSWNLISQDHCYFVSLSPVKH